MPYVTITATQRLTPQQKKQLLQGSSDAVVESLQAPLSSVRVVLHELPEGHYLNAGQFDTAAIQYEVDLIEGRSEEAKAALIKHLSKVAHDATGISEEEVRTRMTDFPTTDIGMANGITAKQAGR